MRQKFTAATLALSAFSLSGCLLLGSGNGGENGSVKSEEKGVAQEEEPQGNSLGETVELDSGLLVSISEPQAYDPSEGWHHEGEFPEVVTVDVTLENQTGEVFDTSMSRVTARSAGIEGSALYDVLSRIGPAPETDLLNGEDVTYQVILGVEDSSDMTVQYRQLFSDDLNSNSVIFVSQ